MQLCTVRAHKIEGASPHASCHDYVLLGLSGRAMVQNSASWGVLSPFSKQSRRFPAPGEGPGILGAVGSQRKVPFASARNSESAEWGAHVWIQWVLSLAGKLSLRKVPIVSPTLGVGLICAQRKHQTRIRETLENDSASPMWGCGFAGTKRGFGGSGNGPGCRLAPGVPHLRIQRRSAAPLQ